MPKATHSSIAAKTLPLRIIWLAFIAAIFAYALILTFMQGTMQSTRDISTLRLALIVVAVLHAGFSLWWRHHFDIAAPPTASATPQVDESFEELRTKCIIAWAISEAVAINGFVLGLLTGNVGEFLPFAAASLALLFLHRPTAWKRWPAD